MNIPGKVDLIKKMIMDRNDPEAKEPEYKFSVKRIFYDNF